MAEEDVGRTGQAEGPVTLTLTMQADYLCKVGTHGCCEDSQPKGARIAKSTMQSVTDQGETRERELAAELRPKLRPHTGEEIWLTRHTLIRSGREGVVTAAMVPYSVTKLRVTLVLRLKLVPSEGPA